jgi:hypothetical protein
MRELLPSIHLQSRKDCCASGQLLTEEALFMWTEELHKSFDALLSHLTSEPVVRLHYPDLPTRVENDCSGFAIGSVLSHEHSDVCYPVASLSSYILSQEAETLPLWFGNHSLYKSLLDLLLGKQQIRDTFKGGKPFERHRLQIPCQSNLPTWTTKCPR